MRIFLYILVGLAVVATAGLGVVAIIYFSKAETEANKAKTAPARAARWAKREEKSEPEVETVDNSTEYPKVEVHEEMV